MIDSSVDLPEPFTPTTQTNSPAATSKSILSSTRTLPRRPREVLDQATDSQRGAHAAHPATEPLSLRKLRSMARPIRPMTISTAKILPVCRNRWDRTMR